ncbi:WD repeat-containing protein 44 [Aplysia californica]|uniref:WD repeat-containing protein 44 n=1 Tax=Aplysia californica TaxID=6500 RepID=A0ABM1ADE9_APLCA|nr:WD repeat-containing protein 44 [Aplysia californica]XP_012945556.1 WD repeat-containing protein 44 [Aplysia californica]
MSSSSDQDEFYDAPDTTPHHSHGHRRLGSSSAGVTLSDIEEEERRLLQLKRRAEERRKREDEELELRLQELQQQKRDEAQNKEQEPPNSDLEGRRRKLEEMRQTLGSDRSFFSTSHDSSLENDSPNTSADIPDVFALSGSGRPLTAPKSNTIEKMENNGCTSSPGQPLRQQQHAKKRSGSWGDLPKNDSQLTAGTSLALSQRLERISSQGDGRADAVGGGSRGSGSSISDRASVGSVGKESGRSLSREDKLSDLDQNMDRFQPEKEKQNKSLTLLITGSKLGSGHLATDTVVDTILQQTQVQADDSEPDIVKSTKSQQRTPPTTLQPPVAPPRRKKSRNLAQLPGPSATDLPEPPSPMFGRREPPSPCLGMKNRENALDLKTVMEGSRHIHAQEAERTYVDSVQLTPSSERNIGVGSMASPNGTEKLSYAGCTDTMDDNMDSLSVQIQHWQSLGDGGREASPNRRPRSNSGHPLTDEEILELVTVRNLDTGETIPLSTAEDKLPKCVNPLALHIMRRTKEYSSDTSLHIDGLSDESDSRSEKSVASSSNIVRRKGVKIKKFFGKTVNKMKSAADQALHSDQVPVEEEVSVDGKVFKIKSSSKNKGPYDFSQPNILQELSGDHNGAIWTMKFSPCGKLLATGGQDSVLRIWVLKSTYSYFEDFRQKYSDVRLSPAESHESLNSASSSDLSAAAMDPLKELNAHKEEDEVSAPFRRRPFCVYKGHTADLLDLSWSKNYFILSSSMDKTVRLWHISRRECLCTFQHIDFVTAIVFHPKDDRYFLSGSLDGKLRLWNIPDKKVTLWNELSGNSNLITTANFCYNGRLAVVGTYDGKCIFYTTEQLKYYTMVNVRSSRGKNSKGRKITGIEAMPGEEKILVTSNDSRIRLYNLRDLTLSCKYKGCMNNSSQIRASFSPTGKYVICGSEDHFLYVWKTNHEFIKFTSARRDRNDYWEAIKVHNAVVTSAIFAPNPSFIFRMAEQQAMELKGQQLLPDDDTEEREIIISADFTGAIKVITNRPARH